MQQWHARLKAYAPRNDPLSLMTSINWQRRRPCKHRPAVAPMFKGPSAPAGS